MPYGYKGKILRVDLSNERLQVEKPPEVFYRKYFGGMGFVSYYLLREMEPGVDPLGPKNKLVFAAGPVTGAPISGAGRNSVGAKSPLTGGFGESEVGGFWGTELKRAGFDAIIAEGCAKEPVYLWVHDGQAETKDANHFWSLDTGETQDGIRRELGDDLIRTAQIGPAGERMVRYASVMNDLKHAAGRCGMGAVMGSKNLKAIAVRGHGRIDVSDPAALNSLATWLAKNVAELSPGLHTCGTSYMMDAHAASGNLPVHNFRDGDFQNPEAISSQAIKNTVRVGMGTCFACAVRCKKEVRLDEPWKVSPRYGGPEYETLAALGSDCGVDDLMAICKANELCQKYSLDTISTGATIAFAMECFENSLITEKDTDGVDLQFGNAEALIRMVEMIGLRKGIGDLLAEGSMRAAKKIGRRAEEFAVHVKGQEVPMHDPRLKKALGLGYATSPTGADHNHNFHDTGLDERSLENLKSLGILETVPVEALGAEKIRLLIYSVNWSILNNCLVLCSFPPWSYNQITDMAMAVTGWNTSAWELTKVAERNINLARVFNLREGITEESDWLPKRFFRPTTSGPLSSTAVNPEELKHAKRIYYGMMGWDEDTGTPKTAKLQELDIGWAAEQFA